MGTWGTAAGGCPSPTAPAELPPAPARCCARHSAPAPHGAPLRAWGNRCGARGLLTSVSIGSTSIPFHSSSRWAIGMLPGDASQEERRNETTQEAAAAESRGRSGGTGAGPGAGPSALSARWLRTAQPGAARGATPRCSAPLPTRAAAKVAAEAALRRCYSNGTAGAARSRCALPRPPSSAVRARGAAEGRGN